MAGAESNVAIGLARLGHRVRWAGRVGADELGALVLRTLRAEGVDIGHAATDETGRPTGLLLTEPRLGTLTRVSYYRAGSAVDSAADFARRRGIPAVLGEGVVGYTPLLTRFEEDAVGKDIAEFVVDRCLAAGFQGVVLNSNAAPHHPMWHTDQDWMRRVNARVTTG